MKQDKTFLKKCPGKAFDNKEENRAKSRRRRADTLVGKCLVRTCNTGDAVFDRAVIYITECGKNYVKGVMINKLLFGTAVLECKNKSAPDEKELKNVYEDLYQGGPENPANGFVLFPKKGYYMDDPFATVVGDIAISTSFVVLQDILEGEGPNKKLIAMGHCRWNRGELEWEIFNNRWLIVPSNSKLLFDTRREDRWEQALKAGNIELSSYIPQIGIA